MRDTDLCAQILGLRSPWRDDNVALDGIEGEVTVHVVATEQRNVSTSYGQLLIN